MKGTTYLKPAYLEKGRFYCRKTPAKIDDFKTWEEIKCVEKESIARSNDRLEVIASTGKSYIILLHPNFETVIFILFQHWKYTDTCT